MEVATSAQIPINKGKGKAHQWVVEHLNYPHDQWCLIWPFSRDKHGRGMLGYNGKSHWAHRMMCEMTHGPAPEGKPHAAHSCGNGHEGCVNPHHVSWKTVSENMEDRWKTNLVRHPSGTARRLLPNQVREIQGAKGFRTQGELAAQYGISESAVNNIWCDRTYRPNSKIPYWTPEEDQKIRDAIAQKQSLAAVGRAVGRPPASVNARAARLGLKSAYEANKPRALNPGLSPTNKEQT